MTMTTENKEVLGDAEQNLGVPSAETGSDKLSAVPRQNYWTEREAGNDIELPRCVHGEPRNVFCGKCEE